jgi:hypothetical protein
MIVSVGSETVSLIGAGTSANFGELTGAGLVNLTTIFPASSPEAPAEVGRVTFKAVHNRHSIILGDPLPQQVCGFCFPWE